MLDLLPDAVIASLRFGLGLVFVLAGIAKLLTGLAQLKVALRDYQVMPTAIADATALTLPWFEVAVGCSLLLGLWGHLSLVLAAVALVAFTGAAVLNLARGRRDLTCGCFGVESNGRITWWLVARNMALLATAVLATTHAVEPAPWERPEFAAALVITVGVFASTIAVRSIASWSSLARVP